MEQTPTALNGAGLAVAVARETAIGERRVALVPESVRRLVERGVQVGVQTGAGEGAFIADRAYVEAGAGILADAAALRAAADVLVMVRRPGRGPSPHGPALGGLRPGAIVIGLLAPDDDPDLVEELARSGLTGLSLDIVPPIARALRIDGRASQGTVAGYKAALLAADHLARFFPFLITPAGATEAARLLVLGAGFAGCQAIATARRLGATVEAYDSRSELKGQVESLGATFVAPVAAETDAESQAPRGQPTTRADPQRALIAERAARADAVIATAVVPGRPAPLLIHEESVAAMRPGAVIVDLAADSGGNCELTVPGQTVIRHGVTIVGATDAASALATHASQLYSRNVEHLLRLLVRDHRATVELDDPVVGAICVAADGEVRHAPSRARLGLPPRAPQDPGPEDEPEADSSDGPRDDATRAAPAGHARATLTAAEAAPSAPQDLTANRGGSESPAPLVPDAAEPQGTGTEVIPLADAAGASDTSPVPGAETSLAAGHAARIDRVPESAPLAPVADAVGASSPIEMPPRDPSADIEPAVLRRDVAAPPPSSQTVGSSAAGESADEARPASDPEGPASEQAGARDHRGPASVAHPSDPEELDRPPLAIGPAGDPENAEETALAMPASPRGTGRFGASRALESAPPFEPPDDGPAWLESASPEDDPGTETRLEPSMPPAVPTETAPEPLPLDDEPEGVLPTMPESAEVGLPPNGPTEGEAPNAPPTLPPERRFAPSAVRPLWRRRPRDGNGQGTR